MSMKIENQIVGLELAKQLKELGIKQDSVWDWVNSSNGYFIRLKDNELRNPKAVISAFTTAELGEMLPAGHISSSKTYLINCPNAGKVEWYVNYIKDKAEERICENTEVNARAKCLTYLLEQNIIKVEDINSKL